MNAAQILRAAYLQLATEQFPNCTIMGEYFDEQEAADWLSDICNGVTVLDTHFDGIAVWPCLRG